MYKNNYCLVSNTEDCSLLQLFLTGFKPEIYFYSYTNCNVEIIFN